MRLLLTNDDGYHAAGIQSLYKVLAPLHDVVVVAPHSEQSGIGHAFTFHSPLRYRPLPSEAGMAGFTIHGTPADCVKFAVSTLLEHRPEVVVSGINKGENSGTSGFYSGTVAAAREGAFWQVPSVAFSLCDEGFSSLELWAQQIPVLLDRIVAANKVNADNPKNQVFFNVNFPGCTPAQSKGLRLTRQSMAFFDDRYKAKPIDRVIEGIHFDQEFLIYGTKAELEDSDLYDSRALLSRYIALTPLCFDATAHAMVESLRHLEF